MSILTKFDALLSEDLADDYWGDAGIDFACKIATSLSEVDWRNLSTMWKLRPCKWQCRFANILDGVDSKYGIPILFTMLSSHDDTVVLSVVDSLDGLDNSFEKYVCFADPGVLERLKDVQRLVNEDEYRIIQEVYDRIFTELA